MIEEQYALKIVDSGLSLDEGSYYTFQLSPQQQLRIRSLKEHQIKEFEIKAKMFIADNMGIPLGQNNGAYQYAQGMLRLSGSNEFVELMLIQLFGNNQ